MFIRNTIHAFRRQDTSHATRPLSVQYLAVKDCTEHSTSSDRVECSISFMRPEHMTRANLFIHSRTGLKQPSTQAEWVVSKAIGL